MGRQLAAVLLILFATTSCSNSDWRTASHEPAGIAPSPELVQDAVIEVYAADAFSWRGWFAVHTWLAFKEQGWSHCKKWWLRLKDDDLYN